MMLANQQQHQQQQHQNTAKACEVFGGGGQQLAVDYRHNPHQTSASCSSAVDNAGDHGAAATPEPLSTGFKHENEGRQQQEEMVTTADTGYLSASASQLGIPISAASLAVYQSLRSKQQQQNQDNFKAVFKQIHSTAHRVPSQAATIINEQ